MTIQIIIDESEQCFIPTAMTVADKQIGICVQNIDHGTLKFWKFEMLWITINRPII